MLWVYQHAGIQDAIGIQSTFGRPQRLGERVGTLFVVPGTVRPPYGVMGVMVPPAAITASDAACLIAAWASNSPPTLPRASNV